MRAAIKEYMARAEVYEQEKREDQARWEHYQAARHTIPHEAVEAWLDSWGSDRKLPCPT
jgi:predicted transcriptional regulator